MPKILDNKSVKISPNLKESMTQRSLMNLNATQKKINLLTENVNEEVKIIIPELQS